MTQCNTREADEAGTDGRSPRGEANGATGAVPSEPSDGRGLSLTASVSFPSTCYRCSFPPLPSPGSAQSPRPLGRGGATWTYRRPSSLGCWGTRVVGVIGWDLAPYLVGHEGSSVTVNAIAYVRYCGHHRG